MNILKDRIKMLREELGLSQTALSKKIGINPNEISRYETGKIFPGVSAIVTFSQFFKVPTDYLLFDNASRIPLRVDDKELLKYIEKIQIMNGKDRDSLYHIVDALESKNKLKALANETN